MRDQIEKRPSVVALAALILGLTAPQHFENILLLFALLILCVTLQARFLSIVFVLIGLVLSPKPLPVLASSVYSQEPIRILSQPFRGTVDSRNDGLVNGYRVRVIAPLDVPLHIGDVVKGGELISPVSEEEEASYRALGLQGKVRLGPVTFLQKGSALFSLPDKFQSSFDRFLHDCLPADEAVWIDALWFRSGALPQEDKADVASSGAYPFVEASGMQVYLLFGIVVWLLGGVLRIDRRIQIGVATVVLFGYWILTGMHGNTFRAVLTCLLFSTAYLVRREPDLWSVTALAGILFLLFFPRTVYSLGFQLSLLIPVSVGLFYIRGNRKNRMVTALGIPAIVFLAGQPLVAWHTGQFGFGSFLSSLLLGLIAPLILGISLAAFAISSVAASVARGFVVLWVSPLVQFFRSGVQGIAQISPQISVPAFGSFWLLIYYGLWLFVWREREIQA